MAFLKNTRLQSIILFILAILLYVNTLGHQFVLDDEVVLLKNQYVQKGFKGIGDIFSHDTFSGYIRIGEGTNLLEGGRYRPLSLAIFAILYSIFGIQPFPFHLFAVLLYGIGSLVIYRLFLLMMKDHAAGPWIAWVAALFFIVHPVHTEVVANIKSCDEQLSLIFGLASLYAVLQWWDDRKSKWMFLSGVLFLLACFAKENAITLVAITPLALLFFRQSTFKQTIRFITPLLLACILFLFIRQIALGDNIPTQSLPDPLNNPFLEWSGQSWSPPAFSVRAATIIYTLGQYFRLLLFPYPLTHDYYPFHIELQSFLNPSVLISLTCLLALMIYGILSIRRREIAGFGILFFFIGLSITSNVFFPVGTFMAERFLFLPSVGASLAVASSFQRGDKKAIHTFLMPVIIIIALLLAILTIKRNGAWENNETLLRTDLQYSPLSVKLRNDLGTILLTKSLQTVNSPEKMTLMEEAFVHLKFAVDSHRTYYDALLAYGAASFYLGKYEQSVRAYGTASDLYPHDLQAKTGLLYALQGYGIYTGNKGDALKAISILTEAWQLQPDTTSAIELSKFYSILNQQGSSIGWLKQAVDLAPNDVQLKFKLAKAYYSAGNSTKADSIYQIAKSMDPNLPPL